MGLTIRNKESSIDMGSGGFCRLRETIAGILSEEFKDLYVSWTSLSNPISDDEGNERLKALFEKRALKEEDAPVLDFLFKPDSEGKLSPKECKRLYSLIKDYDNNILYGYVGRPDCARFRDFKAIVEECAKNRWVLVWR